MVNNDAGFEHRHTDNLLNYFHFSDKESKGGCQLIVTQVKESRVQSRKKVPEEPLLGSCFVCHLNVQLECTGRYILVGE